MGRPVLMFGECFFSHLGFSHCLTDLTQLGSLMKEIIFEKKPTRYGSDELVRYMKCLYDGTIDLPDCMEVFWAREIPPGKLNDKEIRTAQNLAGRLLKLNHGSGGKPELRT
jgi:hypothetical protein